MPPARAKAAAMRAGSKLLYANKLKLTEQENAAAADLLTDLFAAKVAEASCLQLVDNSDVASTSTPQPTCLVEVCLRADVDLGRQCYGLHVSEQFRYWVILKQLSRDGEQGFTHQELIDTLERYGVKNALAHFKRVLYRGVGTFWNLHDKMIYPAGYVELAQRIQRKAHIAGLHDLYIENVAGAHRDMYLNVSGAIADFEGQIFAGWYAMRNDPTISRFALQHLFNTDARKMRILEKRAGIVVQPNEAESTDPAEIPLDANGEKRSDVYRTINAYGATVWHWRLANTYHATSIRQHPRRGQGRRAAITAKQWIETQLAGECTAAGAILCKLNRVNLAYCETDKAAKRQSRRATDGKRLYRRMRAGERGVIWRVMSTLSVT